MAQEFTYASSIYNPPLAPEIHLSDGTVVLGAQATTVGPTALYYTSDRATLNTIDSAPGAGSAWFVCCDGSDNLYLFVVAASGSYYELVCTVYTKGTGYTWTKQTSQHVFAGTSYPCPTNVAAAWCNTGGGTNGAGHIVLAFQALDGSGVYGGAYMALDAGALLAGTVSTTTSLTFANGMAASWLGYSQAWVATSGFGATTGLIAVPSSLNYETTVGYFTISSSGVVTFTKFSSSLGHGSSSGYVVYGLVYVGAGQWTAVQQSSTGGVEGVALSGSAVGTATSLGSPTNWPGVTNPTFGVFADPGTTGRAWLIEPGTASGTDLPIWRLSVDVGTGTPTWASAATADDTLTNYSADARMVGVTPQPRVSKVDWSVLVSASLADGDTTVFISAPSAPTLTSPANASYQDATGSITFEATYNSTDGYDQNAYAFEIKTSSGSYQYWNASTSALQASIVWNSITTAPGATFSFTMPANTLSNGNTYNWSFASQESGNNLQGPFASPFTMTAALGPALTYNSPTGTVTGTTEPVVEWTGTFGSGESQTNYEVIVESGTYGTSPGSGTQVWTSGLVTSSATSVQVGTPLTSGTSYRAFVQITQTGGQTSAWAYGTFTPQVDVPATPLITVTPTNDPSTGCPMLQVSIQGEDNFLTAVDSSFETGIGTAVGTNCSVAQSNAEALDGSYSLEMTATATGNMSVQLGPYSITAGQEANAFAAFYAAATARTCTVGLQWVGASGTATSTGTADTVGAWSQAAPGDAPPAGLLVTATAPTGATGYYVVLTVESAAAGEIHYVDCVAVKPYSTASSASTWSVGGFVGSTVAVITRSDGVYLRGASQANPGTIPSTTQLLVINDPEVVQDTSYSYSGYVSYTPGPLSSATATSGTVTSLSFQNWWLFDPTDPSGAVQVNVTQWQPVKTVAAAAHMVFSQPVMTLVTNTALNQDFAVTFQTFTAAEYDALEALMGSTKTLFLSSSFGSHDSGYFAFGPQSGGLSMGNGVQARNTALKLSSAAAPYRHVSATAIAQARPSV